MSMIKRFLRETRGDSVTWTVIIIIGVIIGVTLYFHVKSAPAGFGAGIQNAGTNAAAGITNVTVQ